MPTGKAGKVKDSGPARTGLPKLETTRLDAALSTLVTAFACFAAALFFTYYVAATWRWIVMWDGAVMHYVRFLITRGFRPYVDITDMNLPGCYLTEGWAMAIFGWGDRSWRTYEYALMLLFAASGIVIGGKERWLAGIYAAALFTLMHGAEGPMMAVERDEVMTVLLLVATAFFFVAMRWRRPALLMPFGFAAALATSMKPGAFLLDLALTLFAVLLASRRGERARSYFTYSLLGNLLLAGIVLGYLLHFRALGHLLYIARHVVPYYLREKDFGPLYLFEHALSPVLLPFVGMGAIAALLARQNRSWERLALFIAAASGLCSYWVQAKGYLYHRYTFTAFVLLWAAWEICGLKGDVRPLPRLVRCVAPAAAFLFAAPVFAYQIYLYPRVTPPPQALALGLEKDLRQLGGASLQGDVQCFDLVNGCLNALYRLRVVQSTGTTGDLLLFSPVPGPAVQYYREWFVQHHGLERPEVVVLGNEYYHQYATSFHKIDTWPAYAQYLTSNYTPVVERHFGHNNEPAYRIYLRNGSALLRDEERHPLH